MQKTRLKIISIVFVFFSSLGTAGRRICCLWYELESLEPLSAEPNESIEFLFNSKASVSISLFAVEN